jgi:hypothetical protein
VGAFELGADQGCLPFLGGVLRGVVLDGVSLQ